MTRKQFISLVGVLVLLLGAGAWVKMSDDAQWKATDERVGKLLLPSLKLADVAEMRIVESGGSVTIKRNEGGWIVTERADFPADVERIRDLIVKLVELKISQIEPLVDNQRAKLVLVEPKAASKADATDVKDTKDGKDAKDAAKDTGTVLELKDKDGKSLSRLLLGRVVTKKVEQQTQQGQTITRDVPNGRYVIGAEANTVAVVTDPLTAAESKPASWLFKDVFRVERAKVLTSTTGDGKPRWAYLRDTDSVDWKFVGSTEKMDLQKAQDNVSALIYVALADVTDPSQANFAKGIKVKVDTFDGFIYEVSFGDKTDKGLYHMKFTVSANLPKTRVVPKDEKPEDKEKADKAFEEQTKAYSEKLEREKKLEAWTYLISKTTAEPLLRERAQLLPDKKDEKKK